MSAILGSVYKRDPPLSVMFHRYRPHLVSMPLPRHEQPITTETGNKRRTMVAVSIVRLDLGMRRNGADNKRPPTRPPKHGDIQPENGNKKEYPDNAIRCI